MRASILGGIGCFLILVASAFAASADVQSLRGATPLESQAQMFDKKSQNTSVNGFVRQWKLQPPLISHKIDKDKINLAENSCMTCHDEETSFLSGAPPTPDSHSLDDQGKKLSKISMRRYFCTQCHVTQIKAKPLVRNVFVPFLKKK